MTLFISLVAFHYCQVNDPFIKNGTFPESALICTFYPQDHKAMISRNRGRQSKDEQLIERLLEEEKIVADFRNEQQRREELERKKAKLKEKEELIDELMFSEMSAAQIVALHDRQKQQQAEMEKVRIAADISVVTNNLTHFTAYFVQFYHFLTSYLLI